MADPELARTGPPIAPSMQARPRTDMSLRIEASFISRGRLVTVVRLTDQAARLFTVSSAVGTVLGYPTHEGGSICSPRGFIDGSDRRTGGVSLAWMLRIPSRAILDLHLRRCSMVEQVMEQSKALSLHDQTEATDMSGAVASFEDFFELERDRLFAILALATGDRSEAEEIAQDAFVAVLERWDRVRLMDSPGGYLQRTAINIFRKRYVRRRLLTRLIDRKSVVE